MFLFSLSGCSAFIRKYCSGEQKKSRDESSGAGSGVEILINEPYEDGPGGNGQYTRKIYHVGSHLPGWIKGIVTQPTYKSKILNCPFFFYLSLSVL